MTNVPPRVANYYVYSYEHVDELSFVRAASDVDQTSHYAGGLAGLEPDIAVLFLANGWEGDGKIGIVWLPPFVGLGHTAGLFLWFVKQRNNGTSFIASEQPLPFPPFLDDAKSYAPADPYEGWIEEGLMHGTCDFFAEQVKTIVTELEQDLVAIAALPPTSNVARHLAERAQGQMVQAFMSFLDDCYLNLLFDVVRDGNKSNTKLRKSKPNVNPSDYVPEEFANDDSGFFTINGFISDLWASYKFEPFEKKIEMLLKPVDFKPAPDVMFELRKHVALRNAVQHHEGRVGRDLTASIGRTSVPIAGPLGNERLEAGATVQFPVEEIRAYGHVLRSLAQAFDAHIETHLVSRTYSRPQNPAP